MKPAPAKRGKEGERRRLVGALIAFLIVLAILLFLVIQVPTVHNLVFPTTVNTATITTGPGAPFIHISITPTSGGLPETLSYETSKPVAVSFAATPAGAGDFAYLWNFGDGTTSNLPVIDHTFQPNCIYDITLTVTNSLGPTLTGSITFYDLSSSSSVISCPHEGTAGITPVSVAGDAAPPDSAVTVQIDGANVKNVSADKNGDWSLNVTTVLPPEVDGTLYNFTTSPQTKLGTFLTLEGIKATPDSGVPGNTFTLEGLSYPADIDVSVYLGGVSLGTVATNSVGSFVSNFTVPTSLKYAGIYKFTTSPPVLGAQASFTVPLTTATPAKPSLGIWPWVAAAAAAAIVIGALVLLRRKPLVTLQLFQEADEEGAGLAWKVRVRASRRVKRCSVTYGRVRLRTGGNFEAVLTEGGALVYRLPDQPPTNWDEIVAVRDGDRLLTARRLGSIDGAKP